MNKKDTLLLKQFPTVMVPQFENLPNLETGSPRLLMAKDGLWIQSKTPWGRFSRRLYKTPRTLPYGAAKERTELNCGDMPQNMVERFLESANTDAEKNIETAAWVVWDEEKGWEYLELDLLQQTTISVQFTWPRLSPQQHLVLDMHSHGKGNAYFSETDNRSDQGQTHFSLVFGHCGKTDQNHEHAFRLCLAGFFFEYPREKPLWQEE